MLKPLYEKKPQKIRKIPKYQTVKRGEVYLCQLKEGIGSEQVNPRPVIILQNDKGNVHSPTTIIAVITSQSKPWLPIHVPVKKGEGGLLEDSEILLEQIETIDKRRLIDYKGSFETYPTIIQKINQALRVSLGL